MKLLRLGCTEGHCLVLASISTSTSTSTSAPTVTTTPPAPAPTLHPPQSINQHLTNILIPCLLILLILLILPWCIPLMVRKHRTDQEWRDRAERGRVEMQTARERKKEEERRWMEVDVGGLDGEWVWEGRERERERGHVEPGAEAEAGLEAEAGEMFLPEDHVHDDDDVELGEPEALRIGDEHGYHVHGSEDIDVDRRLEIQVVLDIPSGPVTAMNEVPADHEFGGGATTINHNRDEIELANR